MYHSNKQFFLIKPKINSDLNNEIHACLIQLDDILKHHPLSKNAVIKQTFFISASNNLEYKHRCGLLSKQLDAYYHHSVPPTSIIGQPVEDQYSCAVELIILKNDMSDVIIKRKEIDNTGYSVLYYNNTKEVYAGGISSPFDTYDPLKCSRNAFKIMQKILEFENLSFGNVVRQWNYIEGILETKVTDDGVRQNYQIFNDIRSVYYSDTEFDHGYPAATGIGMNTGGIILEFIAIDNSEDVTIIPIKNPRQINAYAYSREVLIGKAINEISEKTAPKFERAKFTSIENNGLIYVSGTAAIVGQKTIPEQDAVNQTVVTIENINHLISEDNLISHKIKMNSASLSLSLLRAYVKNKNDIEQVKKTCTKYFPGVPALFLVSDICRDNLLVELEGIATWM